MRRSKWCSILHVILVAALMGFAFFLQQADARGGGGGFSGGTFRGSGGYVEGPRGGAVAEGPRGGVAARGPDGGAVARGPEGGVAARGREGGGVAEGPRGGVAVRGSGGGAVARGPEGGIAARAPDGAVIAGGGRATDDWGHFYGPGWDRVVAGAPADVPVSMTDSLPANATAVVVAGQNYYVADGVYYQECFMGSDVYYCTVPDPRQ